MLRCPKCNRTYQDDMQKFCTHDGGRLVPDLEKPKSFDPNATVTTDGSGLDIPPVPSPAPPQIDNLGATMAAPPPSYTTSDPSAPTSAIRPPGTSPTTFPDTTNIGQDLPDESTVYPALPRPAPPPPPVVVPAAPPPGIQSSAPQAPTVITPVPPPSAPLPSQATPVIPVSQPLPAQPQSAPLSPAPKKSKTTLILTVVGVLLLIVLVAGAVASYFLFFKQKTPRRGREVTTEPNLKGTGTSNDNPNANSSPVTPKSPTVDVPANSIKFENSPANLNGKLAEQYVDFYFYYPNSWQKSAKAGVPGAANFVEVGRILPPDNTQENLTVGWYKSKGTVEADLAGNLPEVIKKLDANYSNNLADYRKVSEGKTTVNGIEGYEFRFLATGNNAEKGDFKIWGRVVYLPPGDEKSTKGVTLYMLTTSLAPELKSVDDVGLKGELPIILNSFTLGKS